MNSMLNQHPHDNERGNIAIIVVVVLAVVLIAGAAWYFMNRSNAALTDQSTMQPVPTSQPTEQAQGTSASTTPSTSSQPAITNSSTTDTQLGSDIQVLDQKMGNMNTNVSQSQTVPVEPTEQ
jgi:flagellar basal body-associated protein FliL